MKQGQLGILSSRSYENKRAAITSGLGGGAWLLKEVSSNLALCDKENSLLVISPTLVNCLLGAQCHFKSIMPGNSLNPSGNSMRRNCSLPHFTDGGTESHSFQV